MTYDFIAIPDEDVPQATDPLFQHLVVSYASETNKTASLWRAIPDDLLDFKPHEKVDTIRAILVHQILSERRFFAQFVGTEDSLGRGVAASWRYSSPRASLPGQVRRASETKVTAACRGKHRLVADRDAILLRTESAADLDASGVVSFIPATTGHRSRHGCGWRVSMSRRIHGRSQM